MQYKPPDQTPLQPTWTKFYTYPGSAIPYDMEIMRLTYGPDNRKLFAFQSRYDTQQGRWSVGLIRMNLDGTNVEQLTMPRVGFINDIACDPNNNNNVWVCYSDIGSYPQEQPRIYKSTDLGNTWTDKTNNLPRTLPISSIFIDPHNSNTIIIGTDIGCYRSDDDGDTWYEFNNGLPNIVVTDMAYYAPGRKLRAGTYGRGLWETSIEGGGAPDIRIEPTSLSFP